MFKNGRQQASNQLPVGYLTADPPHLCVIQTSYDSSRHGQNQEKENTPSTELNISLSNFICPKLEQKELVRPFCLN